MLDKHGSSHCCNTSNTARHKCFLSYKKDDAEYSDIFQIPNAECVCEMDKENHVSVKDSSAQLATILLQKITQEFKMLEPYHLELEFPKSP